MEPQSRGTRGVMRDLKDGRKLIASYRELQESAKKSCFLGNE
jgi:hypothetical protein